MLITTSNNFKSISYGLYNFEIDLSWLNGIEYTFKNELHYRSYQEYYGKPVQIVNILQINNKMRNSTTPIFNSKTKLNGEIISPMERTVKILCGFENGEKIKPIYLKREENTDECSNLFKTIDGCHRIHCSIIYGFKSIPAVIYQEGECHPVSD